MHVGMSITIFKSFQTGICYTNLSDSPSQYVHFVLRSLSWWVFGHAEFTVLMGTWSYWGHCPDGYLVMLSSLSWWVFGHAEFTVLMGTWSYWVHCPDGYLVMLNSLSWWVLGYAKFIALMGTWLCWPHCPDGYLVTISSLSWWVLGHADIYIITQLSSLSFILSVTMWYVALHPVCYNVVWCPSSWQLQCGMLPIILSVTM